MPTPNLNADMTLAEVTASWPGARRALFSRFHIGGCRSCAYSPEETLQTLSSRNDLNPDDVMNAIREQDEAESALWTPASDLQSRLASQNPPLLLDIRTREEFDAVQIPGAHLLTEPLIQRLFSAREREQVIVVYDHDGERALDSVSYLIGHGFANVTALRGGIDAYSQEVDSSLPRYSLEWEENS